MKKSFLIGTVILLLSATILVTGCGKKPQRPTTAKTDTGVSISVGYAHTGSMTSVVEVSGGIKALKSAELSAKMSGRVVSVPYREGDLVPAGATVVQQDTSDLVAQVRQCEAGLLSAKARLSQAATSAGLSDTQTEGQIAQTRAALDAAKANLRMVKNGARSQEVATAENGVSSAKANFENAKVNLDRMRGLYAQGALPKQQMDLVQMQYDVASAQFDTSKQQLSLTKAGAREEQVEGAQKQVEQAQEAYKIALANRAQKALRAEDIKSARAGVAQAKAALDAAQQLLSNASIRTPIAGTVASRLTEPGQMANPGAPLATVVALSTVYFEATVSEVDIEKVKAGQPVEVEVDAMPGRKFRGTVQKIFPTANDSTRQFTVRITVLNKSGDLRPGMFARGKVEVARHKDAIVISKDALMVNGDSRTVFTIANGVAKLRPVTTRFETSEEVEVAGVEPGEAIVTVGQDKLSDGVKVHVVN